MQKLKTYAINAINKSFRDDLRKYFIDSMKKNGFILINDPENKHYENFKKELDYLLDKSEGELLFRRNSKSNFFVFAKYDNLGIKIHYTNPDTKSETAFNLKLNELVKLIKAFSFKDIENAISNICSIAKNKPENLFFANMHSHLGSINYGLSEGQIKMINVKDDGISPDRDMIRNLLIANYDIDASGYHNAFIKSDFEIMERLESSVNIVKIPSIELTLPVEYIKEDSMENLNQPLGFRNGIHHLVYFANKEIGDEIHKNFLIPKSRDLPGEAPDNVYYWKTLKDLKPYFEKGKIAIAIPHPAGKLSSIIKGEIISCGALNLIELSRLRLSDLLKNIDEFKMPVANFNLTISDKELHPVSKQTEKTFRTWIKHIIKTSNDSEVALVEPNLNYGFAQFLKSKNEEQFVFAETDKHAFHPMNYKPWAGAFLRVITLLELNEKHTKINSDLFVKGLVNKQEFSIRPIVFAEFKKENGKYYLRLIKERELQSEEKTADKISSFIEGTKDAMHVFKELVKAGVKKIKSFF